MTAAELRALKDQASADSKAYGGNGEDEESEES